MMPDGVALREVEDNCATLYHALCDLSPIVVLTWPPTRQPSLGTEGGQPPAPEQLSYLNHMGEMERKWYMKQHEFTTSLQRCVCFPCLFVCLSRLQLTWARVYHRNLTRLTLLAQRVRDDPDAAYRGNVLDRISRFTAKFEDIALRLKVRMLHSQEPSITCINHIFIPSLLITFVSNKSTARACATRRGVPSLRLSRQQHMNTIRQFLERCARTLKRSSMRCVP